MTNSRRLVYSYRNGSRSWYCSSDGRQVSRWWNRWRRRTADNFGGCTAGCRLSANLPNRQNGHCECSHYSCWYWAAQRPQAKATCPERAPRDRQSGEGWTCKAATVCWFEAKVSDPNWPCESAANLWLQIGRRNISHTSWRTKKTTQAFYQEDGPGLYSSESGSLPSSCWTVELKLLTGVK